MSDFLPRGLPAGLRRRSAGLDARPHVRVVGGNGIVQYLKHVAGVGP